MKIRILCLAPDETLPSEFGCFEGAGDFDVVRLKEWPVLLERLKHSACDAVLASFSLPAAQTEELLEAVHQLDPGMPTVAHFQHGSLDDVIRFTKLGAFHVLIGNLDADRSTEVLRSAAAYRSRTHQGRGWETEAAEPWRRILVGQSRPMQRVSEVIRLIAARRSTVLITGGTGTGKEVAARAIHMASGRGSVPMVAVNCSAIPENLIEAELFGYVKGAFTGAIQNRIGKFEQANGGTIFLDEIGELPLELQAKLLRVLQERELQRLGSSDTIRLNVRVIAATNVDLEEAVRQKRFRQDLFYRLNVVPLRLPSLHERREDIPLLVQHFIQKICAFEGLYPKKITEQALQRLSESPWPGNVRQLEHAVEMAIVLSGERQTLFPSDFSLSPGAALEEAVEAPFIRVPDGGLNFDETVSQVERAILEQALSKSGGNKARAADLLQMKRTTLLAKIKSFEFPAQASAGIAGEAVA